MFPFRRYQKPKSLSSSLHGVAGVFQVTRPLSRFLPQQKFLELSNYALIENINGIMDRRGCLALFYLTLSF